MDITSVMEKMDYGELTEEIRRTMRRSARDAVQLGFMLRRVAEERLWEAYHDSFDGYLREELHMEYSLASRFMKINEKYSVSGKSMDIKPEYEGYSQGVLIEMLNMPPELEGKVTPDMTVKEVRGIKRQAEPEKEKPVPEREETETVIDGEYREVPQEPEEKVATSQPGAPDTDGSGGGEKQLSAYGLPVTEYPEGSLLTTEGCGHSHSCFSCAQECVIRQKDRYCVEAPLGAPFHCTTMDILGVIREEKGHACQFINQEMAYHRPGDNGPDPCCKECMEICGYRCQRSLEGRQGEEETHMARKLLAEERALLDGYMEAGDIPEMTVLRQKIKVEALTAMVESLEAHMWEYETVQPELPVLKNNDQRKEWLKNYKAWGLWYRDENIDVNYYKYDFRDGSRLVVAEYPQRQYYWRGDVADEYYFHLLEKGKESYGGTRYDGKYRSAVDSETYLVEFLKNLQKKG